MNYRLLLCCSLLLSGCQLFTSSNPPLSTQYAADGQCAPFFPAGLYVRREEGYYFVTLDSIRLFSTASKDQLRLERTITYTRYLGDSAMKPEVIRERPITGYYDPAIPALFIPPAHLKILFHPDKGTLQLGSQVFEKKE